MQDTRGISLECHIKQQHVDGFSSGVIGVSMSEPHTSVFNYDSLYNLCAQKGCLGHGMVWNEQYWVCSAFCCVWRVGCVVGGCNWEGWRKGEGGGKEKER